MVLVEYLPRPPPLPPALPPPPPAPEREDGLASDYAERAAAVLKRIDYRREPVVPEPADDEPDETGPRTRGDEMVLLAAVDALAAPEAQNQHHQQFHEPASPKAPDPLAFPQAEEGPNQPQAPPTDPPAPANGPAPGPPSSGPAAGAKGPPQEGPREANAGGAVRQGRNKGKGGKVGKTSRLAAGVGTFASAPPLGVVTDVEVVPLMGGGGFAVNLGERSDGGEVYDVVGGPARLPLFSGLGGGVFAAPLAPVGGLAAFPDVSSGGGFAGGLSWGGLPAAGALFGQGGIYRPQVMAVGEGDEGEGDAAGGFEFDEAMFGFPFTEEPEAGGGG